MDLVRRATYGRGSSQFLRTRAELMRRQMGREYPELCGHASWACRNQDRIRQVLQSTLCYNGCKSITMKNSSLPSSAKAVWLNSYFGCWNISKCDGEKSSKQELALKVVPEPNDWAWALLGRQSLWDPLFSLMKPMPVIHFTASSCRD